MAPERARILVTDDRPESIGVVERALGDRFQCEPASSVEAARRALAEHDFELALCDIEMPGESGLVLVEELARDHPDTAIVLVTGVDDPAVAQRAFKLGAHGYLIKPFWPGQLLITVMTALRRRELEMTQRAHSRALEERLQTLMDRAPVPIYVKDRQRRYLLANRGAHEVAGLEPGELIGRTDAEVMPPDSERLVAETDLRVLESEETFEREETIRVGEVERTFFTVKFPYVDDSGRVAGISGVSADITAKREAEDLQRELTAAQEQAIEELRASRLETVERLSRALEMGCISAGCPWSPSCWPAASASTPRGSSCCAPRRRCTTSARSPPRTRSCANPGSSKRPNGPRWSATPRSATRSSPARTASCCGWRRESPSPTTSAGTARGTRAAWAKRKSRSKDGSSPSPTFSTRCSATVPTGPR
jgi:PAS domain S-box-containing protein